MDLTNALFEMGGALVSLLSLRQLHRDRELRGVHPAPAVFFLLWGLWNVVYYPSLDQPLSTIGGAALVLVNAAWLLLLLHIHIQPSTIKSPETRFWSCRFCRITHPVLPGEVIRHKCPVTNLEVYSPPLYTEGGYLEHLLRRARDR